MIPLINKFLPLKGVFYRIALAAALFIALLTAYAVLTGFPVEILGKTMRWKNLKPLFTGLMLCFLAALALNPRGRAGVFAIRDRMNAMLADPRAIWILFAVYAALFTWQQLTHYWTARMHFIPFSFYDYMLYYFFEGRITYTGLLHGYYHANFILFLLAPIWKIMPGPLVLVLFYGPLAAAAILPLYAFAKEKFREGAVPFFIAFIYLNYRYLQNVIAMNFSIEIFYPLILFAAFFAALKSKWFWYYFAVVSGLLIKEDAFVYFCAVGLWVFCLKGKRLHGVVTMLLAVSYYFLLSKVFLPLIESDILSASIKNYRGVGDSPLEIAMSLLLNPAGILNVFFGDPEKLATYPNLLYRLLFIPVFSPAALLIFIPLFPLFLQSSGRGTDFFVLNYHYAAAVVPFVMIAFVSGFANLLGWVSVKFREGVTWGILVLLLLINGGHYRAEKLTPENTEPFRWAQSIPQGTNVVTHGHLLPYIGYRELNYYIAAPWEREEHPYHRRYSNADYYLIDLTVNPYPMSREFLGEKIEALKKNPDYELIRSEPSKRFLFRRRGATP